jgi:hypothetical protein
LEVQQSKTQTCNSQIKHRRNQRTNLGNTQPKHRLNKENIIWVVIDGGDWVVGGGEEAEEIEMEGYEVSGNVGENCS